MKGRRILDRSDGALDGIEPGDYWLDKRFGKFVVACPGRTPDGGLILGTLTNHSVLEHQNGEITVSPSILITTTWGAARERLELYHGFLEHGIWRSV